jgi:4-amino-4-deoxy-L-arabinose transferase-like glycosyltransferase
MLRLAFPTPNRAHAVASTSGEALELPPGGLSGLRGISLAGTRSWLRRSVPPELVILLITAAVLDLWDLSRNGWANGYYAAAVRSMITSWHNFLFASFDPSGVMTVDKPPLAFWVQALSARVFGFSSWSILVPEALMGMATVGLTYDLVRRRFGRAGGFIAGATLAITPITVAMSRHNNPDAAVVLCCVAALWCAVRALEGGSTKWIVWSGVMVGLGFEAKMSTALLVVPAIALAWLWSAPTTPLRRLRQLLAAGAALLAVAGAWPLLVALTPAADRPWVSGTADNSIWSLITNYNGVGRISGQSGGPAGTAGFGGGGSTFGGSSGLLRLFNSALGGQVGWLLGFALVGGLGIVVVSRLRPRDPNTGWILAVGGSALTAAVVFSLASGIFHPYYVSFLAPFSAALIGAGAAQIVGGGRPARVLAPLALGAAVTTEIAVMHSEASYRWLEPAIIAVAILAAIVLLFIGKPRVRLIAITAALATLSITPAAWAVDTLGHATSSTFPAGGPQNAGGGFGGPGGRFGGPGGRFPGAGRGFPGGSGAPGARTRRFPPITGRFSASASGIASLFGRPNSAKRRRAFSGGGLPVNGGGFFNGNSGGAALFGRGFGGFGGFGAGASLGTTLSYIRAHGGGTLAVSSQTTAETAVIDSDARVAGIGGFSGNESEVSASWLAQEVRSGKIRWVLDDQAGGFGGGFGGISDGRVGSRDAMRWVSEACRRATTSGGSALYDCSGRAARILAVATRSGA